MFRPFNLTADRLRISVTRATTLAQCRFVRIQIQWNRYSNVAVSVQKHWNVIRMSIGEFQNCRWETVLITLCKNHFSTEKCQTPCTKGRAGHFQKEKCPETHFTFKFDRYEWNRAHFGMFWSDMSGSELLPLLIQNNCFDSMDEEPRPTPLAIIHYLVNSMTTRQQAGF